MSEQDVFSFSVKADVEVEKSSMSKACQTLDSFYNKYNNKKMKIDTRDMVKAAQEGIGKIQKLYTQGMDEAAKDGGISWWQVEDGLDHQLASAKNKIQDFFNEAKLIFSDGSMFSVLDENLDDILSDKFSKGITVIAADLGERAQYLKQEVAQIIKSFKSIGAVQTDYYDGTTLGFSGDDMSESQLERRLEYLRRLVDMQKELEVFEGSKFDQYSSPTGMTTKGLKNETDYLEDTLGQLKAYNAQVEEQYKITTQQLEERQRLIREINNYRGWNSGDQQDARDNILDESAYKESIDTLEWYIDQNKALLDQFRANENELFRADGIEQYVNRIQKTITEYQGYIKELGDLKDGTGNIPLVNADFSGVVDKLEEVRKAIADITDAFKPLTDALSSEDSALGAMVKANIADLNALNQKVEETFKNIEALSKKEFNVTQNFTSAGSAKGSASLESTRQEAQQLYDSVNLITTAIGNAFAANKGLNREIGMSWASFAENAANFSEDNYGERITSVKTAETLKKYIASLTAYKDRFISIINEINKVKPGAIDLSKIFADSTGHGGAKTDFTIDQAEMSLEETLAKVKLIYNQIATEFSQIEEKLQNVFDFSKLNPDYSYIDTIVDNIYQKFVDLQSKINALDFNLNIPAVVAKVDDKEVKKTSDDNIASKSSNAINDEAKAMQDVNDKATAAAGAKGQFADANKKVASGAENTSNSLQEEQQEFAETADAAEKAAASINELDKITDKVNYNTGVTEHTEEKTVDYNTVKTTVRKDAQGDVLSETSTFINQLKARRDAAEKEAIKIKKAMADLQNFLEQFDSKTNNMGKYLTGYNTLKQFNIKELKDIDTAITLMTKLDVEYNKVTKSFRQGTKSMNPFVNAITGIGEMENKVLEAEIAFNGLNSQPDKLSNEISELTPLLAKMKSYIAEDENGNKTILDIYELAKAYGELNSALRQVNSNIKIQRKFERMDAKDTNFGFDLMNQLTSVVKQQTQWDINGQLTDELRVKIEQMFDSLLEVTSGPELTAWKKQWSAVSNEVMTAKYEIDALAKAQKEEDQALVKTLKIQEQLYSKKKQLANVDAGSAKGQELTRKINALQEEYDTSLKLLSNEENRISVQERQIQLEKELAAVKQQTQNSYGKSIYNRESRYHDTIGANLRSFDDGKISLSDDFIAKISKYEEAYQKLKSLREEIANNPLASSSTLMQNAFQDATLEVEKLRKEILATFKEGQKFESLTIIGSHNFDTDELRNLKATMIEFAAEVTDGKFKFEGFNALGTEMYGTLDKGAGAVEKVTVALREGTNTLYAYQTGTKQVSSSWQTLGNDLANGAKRLVSMYFGFQEAIQAVRQGLTYVKEIDLAMTELKKVTDETDSTYKNFLTTASEVSSVIGSTVSDFTDATAAFARLGYSINESSKMAETAIVYKNVADGLDTVEESTESIISTMMAYGIEADNTMGIIDRFNAVGNNFAITSAGIGEAMQRSASALYAGGNTIDESIGLITAAMLNWLFI